MVWNFQGIQQLERELSYLGGMCSSSLLKKDIMLPAGKYISEVSSEIIQTINLVKLHCDCLIRVDSKGSYQTLWMYKLV